MADLLYIEYGAGWQHVTKIWDLEGQIARLKRKSSKTHKYAKRSDLRYIKEYDMQNILRMVGSYHARRTRFLMRGIREHPEYYSRANPWADSSFIMPAMRLIFGEV